MLDLFDGSFAVFIRVDPLPQIIMERIIVDCASKGNFLKAISDYPSRAFSENNNQLFSLKVLIELKKLHSNAKLNLVGANGITPYYQQLIDFVKKNGLEDSVNFIDKTDDVEKIYEYTPFAIIPSLHEGFSLVAIEAQACGMKVFASTSIPKEVDCGGVAYLDLSKGAYYWATEIYQHFLKHGNNRTRFDTEAFRFEKYKQRLASLYD